MILISKDDIVIDFLFFEYFFDFDKILNLPTPKHRGTKAESMFVNLIALIALSPFSHNFPLSSSIENILSILPLSRKWFM